MAFDDGGSRLVVNDGKSHLYLVSLERRTGALAIDQAFRDSAATIPGVTFARERWPHGSTGAAVPHGSVFARP